MVTSFALGVGLDRQVHLQQPGRHPARGSGRIRLDHHGFGGGQDVHLAGQRLLQQEGLQGQHVVEPGEFGEHRRGTHRPDGQHADGEHAGSPWRGC